MTDAVRQFVPINDDHAVQSVAFMIGFEHAFKPDTLEHARASHDLWRDELPAISNVPAFEIGLASDGISPKTALTPLVQFSFLRPDGSPAWQMRFEPNQITVECTRYTRWERTWRQASKLLQQSLSVVAEVEERSEMKIKVLALRVVDAFRGPIGSKLSSLLDSNNYVAPFMFEAGDLWHSHSGWFSPVAPIGVTLNQLNLDSAIGSIAPNEPQCAVVSLVHLQELRFDPKPSLEQVIQDVDDLVGRPMCTLHETNKGLVSSLLTDDICARIGLVRTQLPASGA